MQNLALSRSYYFRSSEGKPAKKVLGDHSRNSQEILIPASEVSLEHTPKNFHGGQIAEHIQEWQQITFDKFVLQMVRRDAIEFENDIPIKDNAKNFSFSFFFYTTSTYTRFKNKIHNHQVRQVFHTWDLKRQKFVPRN